MPVPGLVLVTVLVEHFLSAAVVHNAAALDTCGVRERHVLPMRPECAVHGIGELAGIPSKKFGLMFCCGCRQSRMLPKKR